jgi:hypothetical protein
MIVSLKVVIREERSSRVTSVLVAVWLGLFSVMLYEKPKFFVACLGSLAFFGLFQVLQRFIKHQMTWCYIQSYFILQTLT